MYNISSASLDLERRPQTKSLHDASAQGNAVNILLPDLVWLYLLSSMTPKISLTVGY